MKLLFILYTLYFILYTLPTPAHATNYYLSPTGSDSNSGTITSPFQTYSNAQSRIEPGDTFFSEAGHIPHLLLPNPAMLPNRFQLLLTLEKTLLLMLIIRANVNQVCG